MLLCTIFLAAAMSILVGYALCYIQRKKQRLEQQKFYPYIPRFSVSDYMKQMEKAGIEVMKQQKNTSKYQLILWAGLDGLRLNDDGTAVWIKREKDRSKAKITTFCSIHQTTFPDQCGIENRISYLQRQLANLQMQNMIVQQNNYIINTIQPHYLQYAQTPCYNYADTLTQCCYQRH